MPKCPKDCKKQNPLIFKKTVIPAIVGNDDVTPPENGAFCNMLVVYEATGNAYLYSSDGIPTLLSTTDYTRLNNLPTINGEIILGDLTLEDLGISQLVEAEAEDRREADTILQTQIDAITASSDVVDIVGTYEELEEYDTSGLTDNDIIKVISDETVGGATTYYRWENHEWVYIGAEGPYYTKNETDALLDQKLDIDALDDALEDYYDKTETDALLADKANAADLAGKQDKLIAGNNITIDQATNVISAIVPSLDNYYTKQETYSQTEVDSLVDGVETEIPTSTSQLTNDSGFLTNIPTASSSTIGGVKVGSGLSIAQDGTLSADAQNIDIDNTLSTTSANPVENRVITTALNSKANVSDIPAVPSNVSAFYNDAGYITNVTLAQNYYNKNETYTQSEVDGLISGVESGIPTKTSDLINDGSDNTARYLETDETAYATASIPYGKVDSTSTSTAYTATVPGITQLRQGVSFWLENGVVTSASGFTVDVNGLGSKPVYTNLAAATRDTTIFNINYTMLFVYDADRVEGGAFICYRGYDANTNTIGYQVRTNSQTLPMSSVTYRYRLLFTSADGTHYVPANNSTSTNATASRAVCQDKIDPFGAIFYYGTTASVAAEARPAAANLWEQYAITLGYSFNRTGAALTLTSYKPVYVKAAPQADGSAIIDATTPYVQELPTTDDGKIYIFLGTAYSATSIELQLDHPVYYHRDGALRLWTNASSGSATVPSYNDLTDKPLINGVVLSGDKSFEDLGSDSLTNLEIDDIINSVV